jgi:hypothetical protein
MADPLRPLTGAETIFDTIRSSDLVDGIKNLINKPPTLLAQFNQFAAGQGRFALDPNGYSMDAQSANDIL